MWAIHISSCVPISCSTWGTHEMVDRPGLTCLVQREVGTGNILLATCRRLTWCAEGLCKWQDYDRTSYIILDEPIVASRPGRGMTLYGLPDLFELGNVLLECQVVDLVDPRKADFDTPVDDALGAGQAVDLLVLGK